MPYGFTVVRCPTHHGQSCSTMKELCVVRKFVRATVLTEHCGRQLWICLVAPKAQATTTVRTCQGNLLGQVLASFTSIVQ